MQSIMPSMYYVVTAASDPEHGKYKDFGHQQNLWSSFGEQFVLHLPCAVPAYGYGSMPCTFPTSCMEWTESIRNALSLPLSFQMRDLSAQVHATVPPAAAHPDAHGRQALQVPAPRLHEGLQPVVQPAEPLEVRHQSDVYC